MHIDFALPVEGDLEAGFKEWQRKAQRSVMDYSFHMAITTWNDKVEARPPRWRSADVLTCSFGTHVLFGCPPRLQRTWKCWWRLASTASSFSWRTKALFRSQMSR